MSTKAKAKPQSVMTVRETAEYLRTNRATVKKMLEAGRIRGFKFDPNSRGSEWRVNADSVRELLGA